jgi:hypothetical protein
MRSLRRSCFMPVLASLAILAGCGGSQPPVGAQGAMPQTAAIATHGDRGTSWVLPEAKTEDLLYVAGLGRRGGRVDVFSYRAGKFVGSLGGLKQPMVNAWMPRAMFSLRTRTRSDVVEYAQIVSQLVVYEKVALVG